MTNHIFLFLFFFLLLLATTLFADNVHIKKVELIRQSKGWAADVWISHDDEGSKHYANWIEVRYDSGIKGGTRVVRRDIIKHSEDDRKRLFYRVYFKELPADATKLTFRGHCKVHSFGGDEVEVILKNKSGEKYNITKEEKNIYKYPELSGYKDYFRCPALRSTLKE